jgi:hypothetical protein
MAKVITALKGKKIKKKVARARTRSGVNASPIEKGLNAVKYYFQIEVDRKSIIDQQKTFIKKNFNKTDANYILANAEYNFVFPYRGAVAFWYNTGQEVTQESEESKAHLIEKYIELRNSGKVIYNAKKQTLSNDQNIITLSPQQRLQNKINNTIIQDLLSLEDSWIEGEETSLDVYQMFGKHGLSGSATIPVRMMVEGWLLDYEDAYHKRCEQAVEGYLHISRPELNRRIKECQAMLADLDRIKAAQKATRKIKIPKVASIDKQISKLKFKKEDSEYKIVSINPAQIVGKFKLFVFNTKYKQLTYYKTDDPKGFIISGSTIKNLNKEISKKITLRKPLDFLPIVLKKTPLQIEKEMDNLTTKTSEANGRINNETILLRAI